MSKKFEVIVGAGQNPDMRKDLVNRPIIPSQKIKVKSIEEAVDICKRFIEENQVGFTSWLEADAGWIFENGKKIGRIAPNGKVFDLYENEITNLFEWRRPVK